MKNKIVTCLVNNHPHQICNDNLKENNIKVGKSYKCIEELFLTSDKYYIPEFASLQGVTVISGVDKYGWKKPCLPKECFRIANPSEINRYKILFVLNAPFYFVKIIIFKVFRRIDYIIRRKYYKELADIKDGTLI